MASELTGLPLPCRRWRDDKILLRPSGGHAAICFWANLPPLERPPVNNLDSNCCGVLKIDLKMPRFSARKNARPGLCMGGSSYR